MDDMTVSVLGTVSAGAHQLKVRAAQQADPASPVAFVLPAMGVPASFYTPFVRNLHRQGMTVVTFDFRGQGESQPMAARGVRFGYQDLLDDLDAVIDLVASLFPQAPRFLLGHSLGGQLALLHAAIRPERAHGLALLASGSVWYRSFRGTRALRILIGSQVVAALSTVIGYWPGHRFGFGGRQSVRLMRDWARQGRTGRYALTGSGADFEAALRELRVPVLSVDIEGDHLAPASAMKHLSGKAPNSVLTRHHYSRDSAGADKLGHFSWVYSSAELSRWIRDWISAHAETELESPGRDTA